MYSSSVTTGDFENYVAREVVSYVDMHYRTIATPRPRRSLHGWLRCHADRHEARGRVRQSVHHEPVLSVAARERRRSRRSGWRGCKRRGADSGQDSGGLGEAAFALRAQLASAAAWSPNPKNPPLYLDLPIGDQAPAVLAKWAANAPLAFIDQYIVELKRYRAIAIEVGDQDGLRVDAGRLHDALDQYGIANTFDIYPGTHTSDVAVRFQEHVIPFFSRTLTFHAAKR
jgi:hypothetical protein